MGRLTRKVTDEEIKEGQEFGEPFCREYEEGDYCELEGTYDRDRLNKLGQLEDIEEEIGIDLITFVKLNKTSKIYDKDEEEFMYFNWIDLEDKCLVCEDDFDEMSGGYLHYYYYFKDYGKKWALTKEELEEK